MGDGKVPVRVDLPPGGSTGQVLTKVSGLDRDATWFTPVVTTITGSATQVAVCDGSGGAAGAAGLTFDGSTLSVGSSFVEIAAIRAQSSSGMSGFIVETSGGVSSLKVSEAVTGEPIVYMGDVNGANYIAADTRGYFDISASVLLQFGDPQGFGNGSVYAVDDPNQKTTSNVKHETSGDITITDSAKGLVLKDTAGTPHYWRISVSTLGVLTATDIGTSPP